MHYQVTRSSAAHALHRVPLDEKPIEPLAGRLVENGFIRIFGTRKRADLRVRDSECAL
jgi:hypothetical protein